MIDRPRRFFKLKSNRGATAAGWLNRHTVYEGRLISITARVRWRPGRTWVRPGLSCVWAQLPPLTGGFIAGGIRLSGIKRGFRAGQSWSKIGAYPSG